MTFRKPRIKKTDRKRKYDWMLHEVVEEAFENNILSGQFCFNGGLCSLLSPTRKIPDYPELIAQRPKKSLQDGYWFPRDEAGTEKRIQILIAAQIK